MTKSPTLENRSSCSQHAVKVLPKLYPTRQEAWQQSPMLRPTSGTVEVLASDIFYSDDDDIPDIDESPCIQN